MIQHQELNQSATMRRLNRAIKQMEKISQAFLWLVSNRSLEQQKTNVSDLVKNLTSSDQHANNIIIQQPKHTIYYPAPPAVVSVIIENLIYNAIQHGTQGDIVLKFTDDGFSIQNNNHKNSESHLNTSNGYGIGLIIVKNLCQKLDWQITQQDLQSDLFCMTITNIKSNKI